MKAMCTVQRNVHHFGKQSCLLFLNRQNLENDIQANAMIILQQLSFKSKDKNGFLQRQNTLSFVRNVLRKIFIF